MTNRLIGTVALGVVLSSGVAAAQETPLEFKVPFPFMVEHKTLPAGEYVVQQTSPDVLLIHGEHGTKAGAYVLVRPDADLQSPDREPILTFTKKGAQLRLTSVDEPRAGENLVIDGVSAGR
jgi:hypothetical protein